MAHRQQAAVLLATKPTKLVGCAVAVPGARRSPHRPIIHGAVSAALALLLLMPLDGHATAPLTIVNTGDLHFGAFAAGGGGAVTVSITGSASSSGSVVIPSFSVTSAATFSLGGEPDFVFAVTLPIDGAVTLTAVGGAMAVAGFVSTAGTLGQLSSGGAQTLSVGATLNVASGQPPGAYTGTFSVVVEYN